MDKEPLTLEQAQALPETQPSKPYLVDWSTKIFLFLDRDNRLMQVVKDIAGKAFFKMEHQP